MELAFLALDDPRYAQELDLRFRLLRQPLGLARGTEVFPFEAESLHLVAIEGERVVGCVLFHQREGDSGRLFQMAVDADLQGRGIGRRLVRHLESELARRGVRRVFLHARRHVQGFYERLGYSAYGEVFEEVGIPHVAMQRVLAPAEPESQRQP
jgi:ribosomal protein S18 acetylase RimI-like enzyme